MSRHATRPRRPAETMLPDGTIIVPVQADDDDDDEIEDGYSDHHDYDAFRTGTVERTLLTYRKLPFADKLWTLERNKGHFIILELNSGIIMWPYFLPKVLSS